MVLRCFLPSRASQSHNTWTTTEGSPQWVMRRWSAGEGRAVAASVEEAEGDEVVGGAEPVGDAGEESELGVDALGEPVGQAVGDRRDDPGPVLA